MRRLQNVLNRLPALCVRSGRFFALTAVTAGSLCGAALAQQPSFTWEQIRDKFLITNPTLEAQAQSIESSRAAEVTAGLRPNPQFQNDTTSATIGRAPKVVRISSNVSQSFARPATPAGSTWLMCPQISAPDGR